MEREGISVILKKLIEEETHAHEDHPPWLDLLESLIEFILERLPMVDYIRFASVCKKWHPIQKYHCLRYSPLPPPRPHPLPWLLTFWIHPNHELLCCSPLEQKLYSLSVPSKTKCTRTMASCSGWLLLFEDLFCNPTLHVDKRLLLYNPITCVEIVLPLLPWLPTNIGLMSTPPTDPDCMILLIDTENIFWHRLSDHGGWIMMTSPVQDNPLITAVYFGGSLYVHYKSADSYQLHVIELILPMPKLRCLEMEFLDPEFDILSREVMNNLVEADGELFLVKTLSQPCVRTFDFRVFKADLSR